MALTPSQEVDKFINDLTDWRGKWIKQFRALSLKLSEIGNGAFLCGRIKAMRLRLEFSKIT